ncbi:MAG: TlpA disulfide reductase family protein [Bacteroidales bacterium]
MNELIDFIKYTDMVKTRLIFILLSIPLFIGFTKLNYNPNNEYNRAVPPKIGEIAPEINLPSTDRSISFSLSELRGKMVLVNFWASLVAPCRFENPNLVSAYQNFKDKSFQNGNGFTIFSVSIDTDLESWKSGIQKDKLLWPYHVSDLQGYDSKVAAEYGVKVIPYNYLIDGNGKIIAINLRGTELSKMLSSQLK